MLGVIFGVDGGGVMQLNWSYYLLAFISFLPLTVSN